MAKSLVCLRNPGAHPEEEALLQQLLALASIGNKQKFITLVLKSFPENENLLAFGRLFPPTAFDLSTTEAEAEYSCFMSYFINAKESRMPMKQTPFAPFREPEYTLEALQFSSVLSVR